MGEQGFATIPRSMLHDPAIPRDAKLVYLMLSSHVGSKRTAWPSHKRMADLLGMSVSTVKRQLLWLREHGHIDWQGRIGDTAVRITNEYVLLAGSDHSPAIATSSHRTGTGSEGTPTGSDRASTGSQGPGDQVTQSEGLGLTELTERESLNESHGTKASAKADEPPKSTNDPRFVEFWGVYPRHVGKPDALRALAKALKTADLETILAGARRYAHDPNREDQFTPHPSTWLRREGWADDPLPAKGSPGTDVARARVAARQANPLASAL